MLKIVNLNNNSDFQHIATQHKGVVDPVQMPATKSRPHPRRYSPRTHWCSACTKCFASQERLRRHVRMAHEGVQKMTRLRGGEYSCPVCEGKFCTRSSRRKHVVSKHPGAIIPADGGGVLARAKLTNSRSISCPGKLKCDSISLIDLF